MISNARTQVLVTLPDGCDLAEIGDWIRDSFHRAAADGRESGVIRDVNGNTIGEWELEPDDMIESAPLPEFVSVTQATIGLVVRDTNGEASEIVSISPCLFGAFEVYLANEEILFLTHADDRLEVVR